MVVELKECQQCGSGFKATRHTQKSCTDCRKSVSDQQRIHLYKVDRQMFDAMYFEQDGKCLLCLDREATHVDHDHACCEGRKPTCGRCVRGLLCVTCNKLLGLAEKDGWLDRAREYLS